MILVYERAKGGHFTKKGKFVKASKASKARAAEMKAFSKKMYNPKPIGK